MSELFKLCTKLRNEGKKKGYVRDQNPLNMQAPSGMGIDIVFYRGVKVFEVSTFRGGAWDSQTWWIGATSAGPATKSSGNRFTKVGYVPEKVTEGLKKGLMLPGDETLFGIKQGSDITGLVFTWYNEAAKFLASSYLVASGSKPIDGLFTPYGGTKQLNAKKWHSLTTVDLTESSISRPPFVHQGDKNGKGLFWVVKDWAGPGKRLFEYSKFTGLVTPKEAIALSNKR